MSHVCMYLAYIEGGLMSFAQACFLLGTATMWPMGILF